jgi:hypothetical protein
MREKGMFRHQQAPVIFITEENIEDFLKEAQNNHPTI